MAAPIGFNWRCPTVPVSSVPEAAVPIMLNCPCGKTLRVADENAGRQVRCPACAAVLTAERPEALPAESPVSDDFEVIEESGPPAAEPAPPPVAHRLRAVVVEEPTATPPSPTKPKKKKRRKKQAEAGESDDELYERLRANEAWVKRVTRGVAFIVLGLLIVVGIAVAFIWYEEDIKSLGGRTVVGLIVLGVLGVAAVGKGVIGLAFGELLGEDD